MAVDESKLNVFTGFVQAHHADRLRATKSFNLIFEARPSRTERS